MALSGIDVIVGSGGLGRAATSKDGVSALVLYNNTAPTGFATDNIIKIFSISEAETLGIIEAGTYAADWYHINEFFKANSKGELWVGYFAVPAGTYDFLEVKTMQNFAGGEIRLMGVYAPLENFADTQIAALQTAIDGIPSNQPCSSFLASDMTGIAAITGWGSVADLRLQTARKVSYVAGQDGGGAGKALFDSLSYTVSCIGRTLGDTSFAAVNQSIGEVGAFNISDGIELEVPAMGNGDLVSDLSLTVLGSLKDKAYSIIRKRLPDIAGTYHERTPTCVAATDDFAYIDVVRVVDKASRLVIAANTPFINSRVQLKSDGTLSDDAVGFFEDISQDTLSTNLTASGEISDSDVIVDPAQDILSTSKLEVTVKILPTAIAEFIEINIGLVTEL